MRGERTCEPNAVRYPRKEGIATISSLVYSQTRVPNICFTWLAQSIYRAFENAMLVFLPCWTTSAAETVTTSSLHDQPLRACGYKKSMFY